jgi:ankyrin repeat protein
MPSTHLGKIIDWILRTQKTDPTDDSTVMLLIRGIVANDFSRVKKLISTTPELSSQPLSEGAARKSSQDFFFPDIAHYLYAGDTPIHAASAGYRVEFAELLINSGADVHAKNRRGAEPLHYAADGSPRAVTWNPDAQTKTIELLIRAGANPNALDKSGVAPLHRAVRQRCAKAVDSMLRNGAEFQLKNSNGSTPLHLAVQNTGRGGSGSAESKILQKEIITILLKAGANPKARDGKGKTVWQCATSDWIRSLL